MIKDKSSWTAELTAVYRATESLRSIQNRLFQDKFAAEFLRPSYKFILKNKLFTRFVLWFMIDRRFPGATDTIVSRIRFVDDCLNASIKDGIEQLVILGAGYDSRAYRFTQLKALNVFEVDHPNTQRLKKKKLAEIFGALPDYVKYVSVNFENEKMLPKLLNAGYNRQLKTLFIWEGVCKYLTKDAVSELLSVVSSNSCKGSAIVFDYLFESMVDGRVTSPLTTKLLDFQLKKGEPYIFGLPEDAPADFIKSKGFSFIRNFPASKIKEMYFQNINRGENLHSFWGLIHAIV